MIPTYMVLALLSMLLMGVVDFIYGRAARKNISYATIMCSQACLFSPASGIWAYLEGNYVWAVINLLGAATSVLWLVGLFALMRSVSLGKLSISAPIYRLNFVVTAVVAILFMDEQITLRKAVGFLLACLAIFLISEFTFSRQGFRKIKSRSIQWALVAMLSIGVVNIIFKIGVSAGLAPTMFMHSQSIFFITFSFLYAYFHQGGPRFSRLGWIYGLSVGAILLGGTVALLAAFRVGEVSIVTPISQLSFVVSVLMATLWMGERLTLRKISGLLLAVGTIAAFSI